MAFQDSSEEDLVNPTVAIAIDKDKNSQAAVKWAVDNLLMKGQCVCLIHVRVKSSYNRRYPFFENDTASDDVYEFFLPFRGYCARKGIMTKEVVIDEPDIVKALVDQIENNCFSNIVLGAPVRNTFTRKFIKTTDVPGSLMKCAPDFCAIYVVSKGRVTSVKSANRAAPVTAAPPRQTSPTPLSLSNDDDLIKEMDHYSTPKLVKTSTGSRLHHLLRLVDCGNCQSRSPFGRTSQRRGAFERRYLERSDNETLKMPPRDRPPVKIAPSNYKIENEELSIRTTKTTEYRDSYLDEDNFSIASSNSPTFDMSIENIDYSYEDVSGFSSQQPTSQSAKDMEAEMRRLRQELKQTMDMYSSACKEALTAKQKTQELQRWKMEEARKFHEAKRAEEAALAFARKEKEKCMEALEAAGMSKKLAEMEAQRRMELEMKLYKESGQNRSLYSFTKSEVRYRKYSVEEIEKATDYFSDSLKIGEGGYGPVYRTALDHTPVAIKALKADAEEGMEQFQREVEVLSSIRHPNMVLLLGACPDNGCLVYEYMDNGSLEDRLFRRGGTPTMPWSIRFKIAAEIATALLFLHQTKPEPIVHRDLKPGNILLDRNYTSKISDVGLARLVPPTIADSVTQYRMTSAAGTFCYIDPEYQQTGMLGIKSDVYSLGIMLLQIITAKPPMGLTHYVERSIEKGTFQQMLDPTVPDWPVEEALSYAKIALQCAELRRKDRPDLGTVVLPELNRLKDLGFADSNAASLYSYAPWSYSAYSRPRTSTTSQGTQDYSSMGIPRHRSAIEGVGVRSTPRAANVSERFVPRRLTDPDDDEE